MAGVDDVYHSAGMVSFRKSDYQKVFETNTTGTANVVNAALSCGIRKMCHVSSVAALKNSNGNDLIDESMELDDPEDDSAYANSKLAAEKEVWKGISQGLNAVIVNPSVILGPCPVHKGCSVTLDKINKGLRFYPPGAIGFVDVRDVSGAIMRLMNSDISGERFIVSSGNMAYRELFGIAARVLNKKAPSIKISSWMINLLRKLDQARSFVTRTRPCLTKEIVAHLQTISLYDNRKICNALDYKFISMEDTLRHVWDFKQHIALKESVGSGSEVNGGEVAVRRMAAGSGVSLHGSASSIRYSYRTAG
jgi:nucleoside-diphosphate-sugar epimerase